MTHPFDSHPDVPELAATLDEVAAWGLDSVLRAAVACRSAVRAIDITRRSLRLHFDDGSIDAVGAGLDDKIVERLRKRRRRPWRVTGAVMHAGGIVGIHLERGRHRATVTADDVVAAPVRTLRR